MHVPESKTTDARPQNGENVVLLSAQRNWHCGMYGDYDIREIPLSLAFSRQKVEAFLSSNGLRIEPVDTYVGVFNADEELVGGGGLDGDIIKCVAVSESERGSGLMARIVSRLQSIAASQGRHTTMVFTKPENLAVFRGLGYFLLAEAPEAILMESSPMRLKHWAQQCVRDGEPALREGHRGAIVMNANPFTLGHQYLAEQAARQVDELLVMVVSEDCSDFPFHERLAMVRAGTAHIPNVRVCETGPYAISAATFPTYFLKKLSDAAETQMRLDADLFRRHIAPALGISARFVGSEPTDALTRRYNEILGGREIERRSSPDGEAISASRVRRGAWRLVPRTSQPYVLAHYACRTLQEELDLTPKPGLVDRRDCGAHTDMDYTLMQRSIRTLRPYFRQMAEAAVRDGFTAEELRGIALRAEQAMMESMGGVNTHKGALFCLGLAVAAAAMQRDDLRACIAELARQLPEPQGTHGAAVRKTYGVAGALENAREGFPVAFEAAERDDGSGLRELLYIMSRLDDTNIYHRCGAETAEEVKRTAARLLYDGFTEEDIAALNGDFVRRGISPGGAADMYALSCFIRTVTAR